MAVATVTEDTPLLGTELANGHSGSGASSPRGRRGRALKDAGSELKQRLKKLSWKEMLVACFLDPVTLLPCVILGMLLNILDGVSYGMIL